MSQNETIFPQLSQIVSGGTRWWHCLDKLMHATSTSIAHLHNPRAPIYLRSQNCFLMNQCASLERIIRRPLVWEREVSLHHKGSGRWVGGWRESQCAALNPPQEERLALENSTNPVYQVSSQHSGRHPDLRVNERRERFWARRQQSGTKLLDKPESTFPNENL